MSTDMGDWKNQVENINNLRPEPSSTQTSEDYSKISEELNTS